MTNWRELGFVPNSDDDDSDTALSTQDDGEEFGSEIQLVTKTDERPRGDEIAVATCSLVTGPITSSLGRSTDDTIINDTTSEGYIDIDQILGVLPKTEDSATAQIAHISRPISQPEDSEILLDKVNTGENEINKAVTIVDISNQPEAPEEQEDQVQLVRTREDGSGSLEVSGIAQGRMDILCQDIESHFKISQECPCPPDQATKSEKAFSQNQDEDHPMSSEEAWGPSTPIRQDFRQPGPAIYSSSVINSSPLSSVSSIDTLTPRPSSMSEKMATLTSAFHVAVPSVNKDHQQWSAPVRNFRERKPIQKNPYLIEGERYRQTLQSRGVKPLRIKDVGNEPKTAQGASNDSQEGDYVAPPEPSHHSKRVMEDETFIYDEENEGYSTLDNPRGQVRSNSSLPGEAKRRKVAHTYSKRSAVSKSNRTTENSAHRKENARSLTEVRIDGIARDDIYDMPIDSSPQRISRNPLEQKSPNHPARSLNEASTNLTKSKEKLQGLFAGMDSDPESESDLGQENGLTRAVSPAQILSINLLSSPLYSSSEEEIAEEEDGEDEEEDGEEDIEDNEEQDEEDESQLIRKFQRKTTGVLPASWWKLNKNQQMGRSGVNRSTRRAVSPVLDDDIPRPGVARAKISSRVRSPDADVFLMGRDDPDISSDEPAILASVPAKKSTRERDTPRNGWVDFDDVVEDDKIDRMLPGIPRRGTAQIKRGKQRVSSTASHKATGTSYSRDSMSTSKRGSNSTRLRQPKITDHVSSKKWKSTRTKWPTAPKIGILDAAQHYRATASAPLPLFIKIAERGVRKRRDQGRQSPSRKLFFLETETDTRDIQSVLRDWREGTLDCVARADYYKDRGRSYEYQTFDRQLNLAPPQDLGEVQLHSSKGLPKSPTRTNQHSQPRRQGGRQSTLPNIVWRGPVSKKPASTTRPQTKSQVNPVTTIAGRSGFTTHGSKFVPQAAQFEIEKPMNHTLRRLHQAPRRAATPDLILLLRNSTQRNSHLTSFVGDDRLFEPRSHTTPTIRGPAAETTIIPRPVPRVRRKRMPKRVDIDTIERRQPQDIIIEDIEYSPDELLMASKPVLQGLLPYGNKYSLSFDTIPLRPGTFFNKHTFIGNGGLSRALNTAPAKEGRSKQGISFPFGNKTLRWGLYQDSVAAEFETITNQFADSAEKAQSANDVDGVGINSLASQVYSFSQFFSNYLASFISFSDSIDLISFGQRVLQALDVCCDRVLTTFGGDPYSNSNTASTRLKIQLLAFSLVFKFQIYQLASVDEEARTRLEIEQSIRRTGQYFLGQLLKCGLDDVRACYEGQRRRSKWEGGIGQEHYIVEAWVISIQTLDRAITLDRAKTLDRTETSDTGFWQLFNLESQPAEIKKSSDIRSFEKIWRIIFTTLPLHHFNHLGSIQQPPNDNHPPENWFLIRTLVARPLDIYRGNPEGHFGTIIDYCRVLYSRCYHLISSWGWANPDIIIPTLYQFFASSKLANLKNETGYGSVEFLQDLETTPSLAIQNSDRCFHLLLKIIALGIDKMKTAPKSEFTMKRLRNMVNRLTPNHGRKYPKEKELRIEHLNALRNHHDLLATLYWAAPPDFRPPLDAIINLVDPETHHLEACNVSIRTWSNLLRFKLHSEEDIEGLEPFVKWFNGIVGQILSQHNAARSEAERIFKAAKKKGNDISEDLLEVNIRCNQKQLEDILVNAFKCLNTALLGIAGNVESTVMILSKVSISNILNSHNRLSHKVVIEALRVLQQYVYSCKKKDDLPPSTSQADDDSQDYGDWSGFDDLAVQDAKKDAGKHLSGIVYDSLRQMISNCFGADKQPEETLLVEVVDTWVLVVGFLVQTGFKEWDVYLNTYSHESWEHLRDTEQTRKFTAYFMTKVIQAGPDTYELNKEAFIYFWFKTLVERESMLKFQNVYTETLLNYDPRNPIFENLPFAQDGSNRQFRITQSDFRFRRLSLISSVLANMRKSYEVTRDESPTKGQSLKQEYSRMLQSMMKSMKTNYEELRTKATPSAYVEFVQTVIGYLQQHTIDLVSVDEFFVNPRSFPLPATDPTYVVGKLKNYGLKLHNQRGQKQLTSFVQSVFERAAIDGEQKYLVCQLTTALSGSFEDGDQNKPTLRAFFIGVIFPAYVECTFCEPCGWILAIPVLTALEKVIIMMREDIDSTFHPCVKSVLSMLASLLEGMRLGVGFLKPWEVSSPSVLGSLTSMFNALARIIPLIDWLSVPEGSIDNSAEVAYDCASFLIKYSRYIRDLVENRETQIPIDERVNQTFEGRYQATRREYIALLKKTFTKEWCSYGGSWFVVRGAKRSEVIPPAIYGEREGIELQKKEFAKTVENLVKVACRTEMFEKVGFSVDPSIWRYEGRGVPHNDGVRGRNRTRALRTIGNLFF